MRDLRAATDEELLRITPRHPRAFDEFYVRHEGALLGYFRRRTDSPEIALDLTGETFVKALASVRRFRPGTEPAVAWLFGIARHTLIDSLRRGRVADRARSRLGVPAIAVDDEDMDRRRHGARARPARSASDRGRATQRSPPPGSFHGVRRRRGRCGRHLVGRGCRAAADRDGRHTDARSAHDEDDARVADARRGPPADRRCAIARRRRGRRRGRRRALPASSSAPGGRPAWAATSSSSARAATGASA